MKREQTCEICDEYERLKLGAETKKPFVQYFCKHGIFVLCGPVPKTRLEADQFVREWKRHLGLTEAPGPKAKKITAMDIARAYEQIPGAGLVRLAEVMGVSTRKIQDALKEEGETFTSFKTQFLRQRRKDKTHITLRFKPRKF